MSDHLFVVTGGPGSGKSALVAALAARGIETVPESGRAVIQAEVAAGGNALPWADRTAFACAMLERDIAAHAAALAVPGPVVFDRGLPDVIGYLRLCGLPVPEDMQSAARRCRYAKRVLVAPPWRAIFVQDAERKQSFAEAEATYSAMIAVYAELGYALVELPPAPLDERVAVTQALIEGRSGR